MAYLGGIICCIYTIPLGSDASNFLKEVKANKLSHYLDQCIDLVIGSEMEEIF